MGQGPLRVGDAEERELTLSAEEVARAAALLGDPNPLHHDPAVAGGSPFGGLIASGGHLLGLVTSLCAAFTVPRGKHVGLGFSYRIRRAVPAGAPLKLRWEVTAVTPSARLRGDLLTLRCHLRAADGALLLEGTAEVLAREDLW